ncbi:MAG: hypothetical protein ABI475_08460 [Methylophilaceae bacterium]
MDKFPIELRKVYFTKSIVVAIPEHVPDMIDATKYSPDNNINVQPIEGSDNDYIVAMTTKLNMDKDPTDPYMVDMECIAILHVNNPEMSKDEALKGVTITGHSVAYGAIREAVSWITGRHPYGSLSLGLSILNQKKPEDPQ